MRIAIVGAGIGGLTAAAALTRRGIDCVVFEGRRSPEAEETGIQVPPNAAGELIGLGVPLRHRVSHRELRRWADGAVLGRTDLTRYATGYFTLPRSALTAALRRTVPVRFGRRCVAVRDEPAGVVLAFGDGSADRFDAVVGADGLHSVLRDAVAPAAPRHSGLVARRAVLPRSAPDRVTVWLGPGRHCVTYPIAPGRLNLVVVTPEGPMPSFDGWDPAVRELIRAAGPMRQWPLRDLPPLPSWHRGRMVLLGDAAHPILPFLAQGAAQAVEDAVTLARCADHPDPFARFEALRRHRVGRVYRMSRAGLRVHHLPDGPEQRIRDHALAAAPAGGHDWLYGSPRARLPAP
ncbi:FAD-dependent monooxygenase [Actinoplanes siamensis]|uniref:Salicylate hydroxylase n=1 Tax=Actinoplanes siamensis TaxID=1223317 RepID=A0A919MXC8_9ACTN|nr:FAD-dependent monooxygenase [Actinoplanes siamensis]GIF03417.1 salicylate hydroxylase [Actinoplanes siamensis]